MYRSIEYKTNLMHIIIHGCSGRTRTPHTLFK